MYVRAGRPAFARPYVWVHKSTAGEEAKRQLHKNAASNLEHVLAATPHKTPTVWLPASYHENYSS